MTAPLATLQKRAERPGETRPLGPLDPALTRDLATAAARSLHSRWEITIVDDRGHATGHGIARPRRRKPHPPPPAPALHALPAQMNITVTETLLRQLAAQPRPGAPPGDWDLSPRTPGDRDGPWALTLPGGRELTLRFDVVPTHACDHRYQVDRYQPSDRLRRLVQIRLGGAGTPCRDCSRWVFPALPPNPACAFQRTGLSMCRSRWPSRRGRLVPVG